MNCIEIKEEPLETIYCDDPLDIDLSDLVKVEITDNPLFNQEEEEEDSRALPALPTRSDIESQIKILVNKKDQPKTVFPSKETKLAKKAAAAAAYATAALSAASLTYKKSTSSTTSATKAKKKEKDRNAYERFRRLKKVKLERERRVVLKELFDDLDYWVGLGLDVNSRRNYTNVAYHDKMINAVECIKKLEKSLALKAETYEKLMMYNRHLQAKLQLPVPALTHGQTRNYLYRCEVCSQVVGLRDIKMAFTHQERLHPQVGARQEKNKDHGFRKYRKVQAKSSESEVLLNCRHCQTTSFDSIALHLHSLLHKELVLFFCPWPRCTEIFGVPSKLKRHHFLDHEVVLRTEEHCKVNLSTRVNLTRKMLRMLGGNWGAKKGESLKSLDNFLEANLEAQMIQDELKIDSQLENVPDEEFENLLNEINCSESNETCFGIKVEPL